MSDSVVLNFHWHIPGRLATGGKPSRVAQVEWLKGEGIRAIVSLEAIPQAVSDKIREEEMNHLMLPVEEWREAVRDPETWGPFFRFVYANLQSGKPVFVHCSAGIRRSVSMVEEFLRRCPA